MTEASISKQQQMLDSPAEVETMSDQEIMTHINFITNTLHTKVVPATGRSGHLGAITYYAHSDIEEKGFITSTIQWNELPLFRFRDNMDTTMRHLREITWNDFKHTIVACEKRITSQRVLTNREKEIFELYHHIDEVVDHICNLIEEVKNLDYMNKLANVWYYGLKHENQAYGKTALQKMLQLTSATQELSRQMDFLKKDIIVEWLGIHFPSTNLSPQITTAIAAPKKSLLQILLWK